jgi:Co/Zn/Cd efflux system component
MFLAEVIAAAIIGSVALFADSMDFLEDTLLYGFGLLALGWGQKAQARASIAVAAFMAIPGLAALVAAINKLSTLIPPEPVTMGVVAAFALAVNAVTAVVLMQSRNDSTVLQAAWLSARNDVIVGLVVIIAAALVAYWDSAWPDIIAGLGVAALHGHAAWKIARSAWRDLKLAG